MIKNLLKKLSAALMLVALFGAVPAVAQERLYIEEWSFTPGGETDYFTIALENGAYDDYTAFQFDLVLPAGLEIAYYESKDGPKPDIGKAESESVYQRRGDHAVACEVHPGFIRIICMSVTNMTFGKTGNLIDVYVTPTPYLKPGDVEIKLTNVMFARTTEEYGFKADELTLTGITAAATSTLPVKVSATNKFSTAVFPFNVDAIPAGLEVYSCNSTNGQNLVLTKQSKVAAYTPYILYAANGYEGTLSGAVDASKYSEVVTDGYLCGAVAAQEIGGGNGYYVMQNKGEGVMFYSVDDASFAIPAGKCWLALPAELQGSASFRLDGTTGIVEVKGEPTVDASQNGNVKAVYDLLGRKVNAENGKLKGIYIIDGKKVILK
ncbi:MAG: hypothetical protein IKY71_03810 [Bacteroidaceae bacterium]|nr:hypothetical protein [Bacteroidaceae bacterium]